MDGGTSLFRDDLNRVAQSRAMDGARKSGRDADGRGTELTTADALDDLSGSSVTHARRRISRVGYGTRGAINPNNYFAAAAAAEEQQQQQQQQHDEEQQQQQQHGADGHRTCYRARSAAERGDGGGGGGRVGAAQRSSGESVTHPRAVSRTNLLCSDRDPVQQQIYHAGRAAIRAPRRERLILRPRVRLLIGVSIRRAQSSDIALTAIRLAVARFLRALLRARANRGFRRPYRPALAARLRPADGRVSRRAHARRLVPRACGPRSDRALSRRRARKQTR